MNFWQLVLIMLEMRFTRVSWFFLPFVLLYCLHGARANIIYSLNKILFDSSHLCIPLVLIHLFNILLLYLLIKLPPTTFVLVCLLQVEDTTFVLIQLLPTTFVLI